MLCEVYYRRLCCPTLFIPHVEGISSGSIYLYLFYTALVRYIVKVYISLLFLYHFRWYIVKVNIFLPFLYRFDEVYCQGQYIPTFSIPLDGVLTTLIYQYLKNIYELNLYAGYSMCNISTDNTLQTYKQTATPPKIHPHFIVFYHIKPINPKPTTAPTAKQRHIRLPNSQTVN